MRIAEIANSAEHLTAEELEEAIEEAEAEADREAATMGALLERREAIKDGPSSAVSAIDVELRTLRSRSAKRQDAVLEVQRRYQAITRWQPNPRPGGFK